MLVHCIAPWHLNFVSFSSFIGKYLQTLKPERRFKRPSDMIALPDGRLAVRDDLGIQLFDDEYQFLMHCGQGMLGRCYGLATDGKGNLITINQGPYKRREANNNYQVGAVRKL